MKIVLNKKALNVNPSMFLRQAGYGFITDRITGNSSYVRNLGRNHYPRLHMYFEDKENIITFNLHLDQKQASYSGSHMHSAEYDGEIVEAEINRLKGLLRNERSSADTFQPSQNNQENPQDILKEMGQGEINNNIKKKKSFLQKFFGLK